MKHRIRNGHTLVVPAGFRCATRSWLDVRVPRQQLALPFDNGFFPPAAVASFMRNPRLSLNFDDPSSYCIVRKINHRQGPLQKNFWETHVPEIEMVASSYEEVDQHVAQHGPKGGCVDNTCSYFTMDTEHGMTFAHYNWHPLAAQQNPKRVYNPKLNLLSLNEMIERRWQRVMQLATKAQSVILLTHNPNRTELYRQPGKPDSQLADLSPLREVAGEVFGSKAIVMTTDQLLPML